MKADPSVLGFPIELLSIVLGQVKTDSAILEPTKQSFLCAPTERIITS